MKKKIALFVSMAILLSLIIGCSQSNKETNASKSSPAATDNGKGTTKKKYGYIFRNTGNPYGEKKMEGFKEAVETLGGEAILRAPEQPTAEGQIQIIQELISQKVDSIVIASNDYSALVPALTNARKAGIKVISDDSTVDPAARDLHMNQADPELIGRIQVQAAYEMMGGEGQLAILSATSQSDGQNVWIGWMKEELKNAKYNKMELVKVAYGDDLRDKSVSETEGLLKSYPKLKAIIAPTTVGIAAAGKVLTDKNLKGKVFLTGLGLPSEMAEYIENGVCPWMYLWNPKDAGYMTGIMSVRLVNGDISGKIGEEFDAGRLGKKKVVKGADGHPEVLLGEPFRFDAKNIAEWKTIY